MGIKEIYTRENSDYLKNNPTWHIEDSLYKAKWVINIVNRNRLFPKTIAEVGCGAGEILNQLYSHFPDDTLFCGYDISGDAIKLAKPREKERLTYKHEDLLAVDIKYDLLLVLDVFEHVEDYIGFLRKCICKTEYAIFHIPLEMSAQSILRNGLITSRKICGHLHYFMKETAMATLCDAGYEITDYFYTKNYDLPTESLKTKVANIPRRILFNLDKDIAPKLLGGFSLMVLAKIKSI